MKLNQRELKHGLSKTIRYFTAYVYFGFKLECTICGRRFRRFLPYGKISRSNAQCPNCQSLERHRTIWLYLKNKTNLFQDSLKVLHFAPEKCFSEKLSKLANIKYITADINHLKASIMMDITNIPSKDNSFDVILCFHVLEHVLDDRKAMKELYRILRPGGWAILQVPIDNARKETFEAPLTTWKERERVFGQGDHVRVYGLDYEERLGRAGFEVSVDSFYKQFHKSIIERFNLGTTDIFLCKK